jgi:hypothetical protein
MKHSERGESLEDEQREIVARGFATWKDPIHLYHASMQERVNESHADNSMKILGNKIGKSGKVTIVGSTLNRDDKGILKRL